MGFRCPACKQDFGADKAAWSEHCARAHEGAAGAIISLVIDIAERDVCACGREKPKRMIMCAACDRQIYD